MSAAYEKGYATTKAVGMLRFLPATNNYIALVTFPYILFAEYVPDADRMYERGEVVREGREKYLIQGDGRLDRPPSESSLCKLFRDSGEYDWIREEFCLMGFVRIYNGERYEVIVPAVDDATPPSNSQAWRKLDG